MTYGILEMEGAIRFNSYAEATLKNNMQQQYLIYYTF